MDKVLVTHTDLDGVTCAILFKAMWPAGTVYFEDYKTVNQRLRQVLDDYQEAMIHITDIAPEHDHPDLVVALHDSGRVVLIDHHKTAMWLNEFPWAWVRGGRCGANMFHSWLRKNATIKEAAILSRFETLVFLANDYDLWKHKDPRSKQINSLLWILGRDRFIERFLTNPDPELTDTEKLLLNLEEEKQARYIESVLEDSTYFLKDNQNRPYALCFAEQYTSQIGHEILNRYSPEKCLYVAQVNLRFRTVSLRSRPGFDVSEIAKARGGGGHAQAAGFQLPYGALWLLIPHR